MRCLAETCPLESLNLICTFFPESRGCLSLGLYVVQFQHAWISISFPPILTNGEKNLLFGALGLKVKQIIALRFVAMALVRRTS